MMKRYSSKICLIIGTILVIISFLIPSELREFVLSDFHLVLNQVAVFMPMFVLAFIPFVYVFLFYEKYNYAYWISYVLLVYQAFPLGLSLIWGMTWYEYLINTIGILLVLLTYYRLSKTDINENKTLVLFSFVYLALVVLITLAFGLDEYPALILHFFAGYFVYKSTKKVKFYTLNIFVVIFYTFSLILFVYNNNCNYNYEEFGVDWGIINLIDNCNIFFLWIFGVMFINYSVLLKRYNQIFNRKISES